MASCSVCAKSSTADAPIALQRCSRCKRRVYCGGQCQKSDWKEHKKTCKIWYDKHRLCQDSRRHEGRLELITWPSKSDGEDMGWGNMLLEESDDMKRRFETEMGGDEEKLYAEWPQAFRWTCCGTDAEMSWGCDHHGTGSTPCTCDYCRSGKPIPSNLFNEQSAPRMGLTLSRGPDPRSYRR